MEAATRPSVQPQGVAGFVPEGRVLLAHLWDPWPGNVFPAERSEVATCSGVLAGPQESLVFLIPGNSIDMYSDNGTSGSLSQPVPGRSPCQGLSASANEISPAKPHVSAPERLEHGLPPALHPWTPPASAWECVRVSRSPRRRVCWAPCPVHSVSISTMSWGFVGALGDGWHSPCHAGREVEVWKGPATRQRSLSYLSTCEPLLSHPLPQPHPLSQGSLRQTSSCLSSHPAQGGGGGVP